MKRLLLTLSLALAVPVAALAQQGPPPGGPPPDGPPPQMRAEFKQMRAAHEQFRSNVLGALTPANRRLLASVVGNLAVTDKPDFKGAVQQLDAALSPGEKNAILAADTSFRQQMKAQMEQFRAAHPRPSGSPWPHRGMKQRAPHAPDAGAILLMVASGRGGMHGPGPGMMGHPRR